MKNSLLTIVGFMLICSMQAQINDIEVPGVEDIVLIEDLTLDPDQSGVQTVQLNLADFGLFTIEVVPTQVDQSNRRYERTIETYKGWSQDGGHVRLTLAEHFIYGYIEHGKETYWIEPAWYYSIDKTPNNSAVVYRSSDVDPDFGGTCAFDEVKRTKGNVRDRVKDKASRSVSLCLEVELAIASDYSMFQKYGSISAVETHNVGVINNVNGNYSGDFNHDIQFFIVEQLVIDCAGCDPWTSSTDPIDLIEDFKDWGENGGFNVSYDLAELWTDRDFDGPTIGVGYDPGVCSDYKYHILQDFSSNADLLRVLTAHEIGHNFDASHPAASDFIMSATVSNTDDWHSLTIDTINLYIDYLIGLGCLSSCSTAPPVAQFSASPTTICAGGEVQFTDQSSNDPTTWSWTFPGGQPSESNQENPTVTYQNAGDYSATLEVSNAGGSDMITINDVVTVNAEPVTDFSFTVTDPTIVAFSSTSTNANSFQWDFGDGNQSTQEHPTHTYANTMDRTVTLETSNACGLSDRQMIIELGNCVQNLSISGMISGGAYVVGNSITSTATLQSNQSLYFHAPGGSLLEQDFTIPLGSSFEATSNGCE